MALPQSDLQPSFPPGTALVEVLSLMEPDDTFLSAVEGAVDDRDGATVVWGPLIHEQPLPASIESRSVGTPRHHRGAENVRPPSH